MSDVIVIGSGPAGASLALYLKRDNYNVTVLSNNNSSLKKASRIANYYGVESMSGEELYNFGIKQLTDIDVNIVYEEVVKIEKMDNFVVHTANNKYESKIVVLAMGITRTSSKIFNALDYEGKGVSYCATCDGFFFKNKKIAVIGSGNLAYEEASYLKQLSDNVTLFTDGDTLKRDFSDLKINIITEKISHLDGTNFVENIILENKIKIEIDGVFIAVGTASASTFSKTLGIEMNNSFIKVDNKFQTNIKGLYAIGDIIGGTLQIGKAVSDGIIASREINKVLKENN